MEYRRTADRLLEVSVIGIGTYAVAGVYGRREPGALGEVLRAAYDQGINFFDTAPGYGGAEGLVGKVLKDIRQKVVISTKVPARLGGLSCSYDTITLGCEGSLESLRTDYIDLYQLHFDDGKTPVGEVVRAFEDLKARGKIRAYGIGHVSSERIAEYLDKGTPSTVMGELNAVSRSYYLKMLPLLRGRGASYIGFSLTGRGMLTEVSVDRHDLSPGDIRQIDPVFAGERCRSGLRIRDEFRKVGCDLGAATVQVAIAWAVSQQGVLTGLVGPSTIDHIDEDVRGAHVELDASTRAHLDSFLEEETLRLAGDLAEEVRSILSKEITGAEEGASSLIYAMEALADLRLADDEDLVSKMGSVMKIKKSGQGDLAALDAIRKDLLDYVKAT
jgi:aryl-alcohol dehydrogenase-like predicted oxidoreductase